MGGRKDDVTRTKKNRNRPLSAVIEEFEVDDPELRHSIVNNNNNDNDTVDEDDAEGSDDSENNNDASRVRGSDDVMNVSRDERTCCGVQNPNVSAAPSSGRRSPSGHSLQPARAGTNETPDSADGPPSVNTNPPCVVCVNFSRTASPGNPAVSVSPSSSLSTAPTNSPCRVGAPRSSPSASACFSTPLTSPGSASFSPSSSQPFCSPLQSSSPAPASTPPERRSPFQIPVLSVSAWETPSSAGESGAGAISGSFKNGHVGSSNSSSQNSSTSPKFPRRTNLRSRRQALTTPGGGLSPKLGRRGSSGRRPPAGSDGSSQDPDDEDALSPTDMARLRQMTDRLRLSTRRPSTLQWREQYVESPQLPARWAAEVSGSGSGCGDGPDGGGSAGEGGGPGGELGRNGVWTEERTQGINTALDWIKNELLEMRAQDQNLARQLLAIRSDIHQLKLARSCEEHQDMLDDVQSELEELQEFADVLDLPTPTFTDSPLRHLGVTRMNLSARRFSTC